MIVTSLSSTLFNAASVPSSSADAFVAGVGVPRMDRESFRDKSSREERTERDIDIDIDIDNECFPNVSNDASPEGLWSLPPIRWK
jgi:hypothetical protein